MRFWAGCAFVAVLGCIANEACAAAPSLDCSALAKYEGCALPNTGSRDAEDYAERGAGLFRITARYALYGRDFAMEVVREAEGGSRLRIRDPLDIGEGVQVVLDDKDADSLLSVWRTFAATWPQLDIAARKARIDAGVPCTDGGTVQIDLSENGVARHILLDDCVVPESETLVRDLAQRAFALVPLCAGFQRVPYSPCLRLDGDKRAAAAVARLWQTYRATRCTDGAKLAANFRAPMEIVLDGTKVAGPARRTTACNLAQSADVSIFSGNADSVSVTGRILTTGNAALGNGAYRSFFRAAPFTQIWRRGPKGEYRLRRWIVGRAVEVPAWF